ncbi:hypothetical protein [Pseudomonas xantholysinigenes]|uniref:Uncharacterized protein n=1 Tax=Pseudomonas xantholysinigenes TaxID=2745490 RepID=A0A9E6PZ34_9PSED|nr:hypothetical protein [Pseudomonas xantholysinigenes]QXI40112.1 hypothetical protein HU772_008565 [Pseudomonas xantholysinigenes]
MFEIDLIVAKGADNAATYAADDIRFSQNSVSFNKTDRVSGTNYTYDDLVQSMKTNGWKGDPVDVLKMHDGKLTSMENTRKRSMNPTFKALT